MELIEKVQSMMYWKTVGLYQVEKNNHMPTSKAKFKAALNAAKIGA